MSAPAASTTPPAAMPETLPGVLRLFAGHASPRILAAALAVVATARLALGGFSAWDLAVVAGIAALWPLQEWAIHVFILHATPGRGLARLDPVTPRKHREHHLDPWRAELIFIPLHTFVYTLPLLVVLYGLLLRDVRLALTGIAVHLALALHYEWVHLLVHTRHRPKRALYRRLWRNHRLHHFKNERLWYGVTMLSGDRLLGTAPDVATAPTSPTCRTLGREDDLGDEAPAARGARSDG